MNILDLSDKADSLSDSEQKELASFVCEIYNTISDAVKGQVISMAMTPNGIEVESQWEDYCRGCHMGTESENYLIPIEALFDSGKMRFYMQQREVDLKKAQEAAEIKRQQDAKKATEREEKATLRRLAEKYGAA